MNSNTHSRNIDVSFINSKKTDRCAANVDSEDVVMSYASLCKTKYVGDVVEIVKSIKGCNSMCDVANQTCTSINNVKKVKAAYDALGEDSVVRIAHKMCKQKEESQRGGVGKEDGAQPPPLTRKKTLDEHLNTLTSSADKSVATVEKLADSADKLATTAVKLTDTGVKIGSALAGLYHAVRPKQDDSQGQVKKPTAKQPVDDLVDDDVTSEDITAKPTSKADVLKNIKYLEDQLEQRDIEILKLAQNTKVLASQLRLCNNKLKQTGADVSIVSGVSCGVGDVASLREKNIQLEAQIAVYTKTIDDLKAKNIAKQKEMEDQHMALLKSLSSDLSLKKDAECKAKIEEELQKKSSVDMQKLTGQLDALINLSKTK